MRKTLRWTVPGTRAETIGQRDNGKTFLITEMPAEQAEWWFVRAVMGIRGVDLPDGALDAAPAVIAALGVKALAALSPADAAPLLAEMMACVQYVSPQGAITPLLSGDACQIEDVMTRITLRLKVLELHTGFSLPVGTPTSG